MATRAEGRVGPLVLLITVDCLRADRLSCNGYERPTTPALDLLAAEGVNFPRAYSVAGATPQGFAGLMLSSYFQNFGRSRAIPRHLTTLAEALAAHGFHGVGFNAANVLISHFYGYGRGLEEYRDFFEDTRPEPDGATFIARVRHSGAEVRSEDVARLRADLKERPDLQAILVEITGKSPEELARNMAGVRRFNYDAADLVHCAVESLRGTRPGQAAFRWLHLMDLHEPIHVPFSRLGAFSPVEQFLLNACVTSPVGQAALAGNEQTYRQLYDSALSYVDMNLAGLFDFLASEGLWDRSLICLTADHGQELLEDGRFGHGYDRLGESVVHVPLILGGGLAARLDGTPTARRVSTLDLAPTVLDVMGLAPPESFLGRSLRDPAPRPVIGQTFYDGVRNRAPDRATRRLFLEPYPRPVKEHCKEMRYCIDGDHQVIHDLATGRSTVHRLRSVPGTETAGTPPDAEAMRRRADEFLAASYEPGASAEELHMTGREKELVEGRLRQLGYL